jgi:SAM-dependent methyltransferase
MPLLPDSYDAVRYPNLPRNQSHPAYISALAMIAGLELPPVERWRVLEIGCGDGSNIIPLGFDYPEGRFVGVDRARDTLEIGRRFAAKSGCTNMQWHASDFADWQPEGEFDYIIAHGVYSWVPPEIREKILEICRVALKPLGVAFISYNAFPGCHFRRFASDLLRFHVRYETDPTQRIESARNIARLVINQPGEEPLQPAIRKEMETLLKRDGTALYHDDLAEINDPFYLLDFVACAARHGLQYLGDADPGRDDVRGLPLEAEDWLESRQYGDFWARRRFRETLLCRRDIPLDRKLRLDRFRDLFAASRVKPAEPGEDGQQRFDFPDNRNLTTNHPLAKDMLGRLASLWPGSMQLGKFPLDGYPADTVAELLMRLVESGALELRVAPPRIAAAVSDRPAASPLARAQAAEGRRMITNQRHMSVQFGDENSRKFLLLLDGSRDRPALARELGAGGADSQIADGRLEAGLAEMHRLCLLTQ